MRVLIGFFVIAIGLLLLSKAIMTFIPITEPPLTIAQLDEKCISLETSSRYGYDGGYNDCWADIYVLFWEWTW